MPYVKPLAAPKPARRPYPSDLSDAEWLLLEPLLPQPRPRGQPRIHPRRELIDAILYALGEGIKWRALPHEFPAWPTVYAYFRDWQDDGTWKRLHDALLAADRETSGRTPEAMAATTAPSVRPGASRVPSGRSAAASAGRRSRCSASGTSRPEATG